MKHHEILKINRKAWDRQVLKASRWTIPVSSKDIALARTGRWNLLLTPSRNVPRDWFPPLKGVDVLCLASGGGQQGPILAAAGANVTVFDNSPRQLKQDELVAERDHLRIRTVLGDMADLSVFKNNAFDLIINPCSNCFAAKVRPIWQEAYRVLRPGGVLLAGFKNPIAYLFDPISEKKGKFQLRFKMPYSDLNLSGRQRRRYFGEDEPLEFAHSLHDQIGGQLDVGFHLVGMYEDDFGGKHGLDAFATSFLATRALRPRRERSLTRRLYRRRPRKGAPNSRRGTARR